MLAAYNGHADVITLLLEAGASIEAKDDVSKRISICTCVCVIFLHHSVVLFSSSILLLWYVGYDDFISMSNVFVFVLIIIILLLVCCLLIWRWIFLRNPPSQFLMDLYIFLYFFILFIFVSPLYTYFW